jgi:hypothetical protein
MKRKCRKSLLAAMFIATSLINLNAQDFDLEVYDWRPQSFPGHFVLISWDGPCGTYKVLTNATVDTIVTNWGVYDTIVKHDWLNQALMATLTIDSNIGQMFVSVRLTPDASQTNCPATQLLLITDPEDLTTYTNQPAVFNSYSIGPDNRTYQWYLNGEVISGATNKTHFISQTTTNDAGDCSVIASALGSPSQCATSQVATLTVLEEAHLQSRCSSSSSREFSKKLLDAIDPTRQERMKE